MDGNVGSFSSRQQPVPSEYTDSRQNTSVRRRLLPSYPTEGKEPSYSETRPDKGRLDGLSLPGNWTELQGHSRGAELRLLSQLEVGQHDVPHAESDRGNAHPVGDVHMSLQDLASQLQALREQDVKLQQDEVRLKAQVKDSEAACGRMIQQYLEIAQAIGVRKQHIQEDNTNLERVQQSRARIETEVARIMTRISSSIDVGWRGGELK